MSRLVRPLRPGPRFGWRSGSHEHVVSTRSRHLGPSAAPASRAAVAAAVLGFVAVLVGIAVMLGWIVDVAALRSALFGGIPMRFNAALAGALGGVSLMLLSAGRSAVGHMLAGVAALAVLAIGSQLVCV